MTKIFLVAFLSLSLSSCCKEWRNATCYEDRCVETAYFMGHVMCRSWERHSYPCDYCADK